MRKGFSLSVNFTLITLLKLGVLPHGFIRNESHDLSFFIINCYTLYLISFLGYFVAPSEH